MYADFRSLEAISALVNIILGAITLILASRTKRNAWNELFAAKLLGWFLIFRGISMFSGYLQGYALWTGPSTYSLYDTPSDTNLFRFFQMLESVTFCAEIAIMCSIALFFPYPFLQTKNAQRTASVFILMFTIIMSGFFVFLPYETSMVRYGFIAFPLAIWGFVYVRFSLKELKHGDEEARTISSPSGLLILAMIGYWMTDWLLWITVPEKWSTPVWVNSLGPDLNLDFFFIRQSLILGVGTCCLLTMFVFEGIRSSRKGNSVLTSLTFGWFIVGIISFIADFSIFDTFEDCIYAVCDGLPEEWLIYNTFTNTLAGYLVQPIVLMYVLLNYDLVDSGTDENGTYARAMVIVLVVIVSSTLIEMIQSIIPIGEIITSAVLAIGIAAAIGWEKAIMEKFLAKKNSSAAYLQTINEIKDLEIDSYSERSFVISVSTIVIFAFILSILNAALGLG